MPDATNRLARSTPRLRVHDGVATGNTSTALPSEVAGLLRAVGFDQAAEGLRWFVVEVDPADRIDAREFVGDAQPVGDPARLDRLFDVEVELFIDFGGHRPLGDEEHTSELQSRQYLVCRLL